MQEDASLYARNTIEHILWGKAIYRAVRAHSIVYAVLIGLILSKEIQPLGAEIVQPASETSNLIKDMEILHKQMMDGHPTDELGP